MAELGMELKSDSEDMKKLQDSDECIKYEEEKHEKTILKS